MRRQSYPVPEWEENLKERFLRYVKVDTQSDRTQSSKPTTENQWNLIKLLDKELEEMGVSWRKIYPKGYLLARIPASKGHEAVPSILFSAHVDVAEDAPGNGVKPVVHDYKGGILEIASGLALDPSQEPFLQWYQGEQVITSDGSTLLGADDKAGVAEILQAVELMMQNPDWIHGPVEILISTDEETGRGMEGVPLEELQSKIGYTMDGGEEGSYEAECYYAHMVVVNFTGRAIHPGYARGKLVNAGLMASHFASILPRSESPEATDGRYGNMWVHRIDGTIETARLEIYVRDFDREELQRRLELIQSLAKTVELAFPGGKAQLEITEQYRNMKEGIAANPGIISNLRQAMEAIGLEPDEQIIRGGTDGARLTEMGLPTPNVFAGGVNFHSRKEWVAVSALTSATLVILKLMENWCK